MGDSILNTIKKLLGLDDNYTPFDMDIIVFINGAMMVLQQLGVGPVKGFTVSDYSQTWGDFLPSDTMLDGAKQYIYLYVKMAFDPPASGTIMDAMNKQKDELEWRLREQAEFYPGDGSRLGYYQQLDDGESEDEAGIPGKRNRRFGKAVAVEYDGAFLAHGGWHKNDPGFPWSDGPVQPEIVETEDGE